MALPQEKFYTPEEFADMDLPERCELINGRIYVGEKEECYKGEKIIDMSPSPSYRHQRISGNIYADILFYIRKHKGGCEVFSAPADVKIGDSTVQPDIFVTCDPDRIDNDQSHIGAPDWVIEVLSPSTSKRDAIEKLALYRENGVREYWIVDPIDRRVIVYPFEDNTNVEMYTFDSEIAVHIYKNAPEPLVIHLADYL